ncbi:MAG: hypothetical protein ACRCXZ_06520 [Patescibacteria group bacterium]
MTDLYQSVDRYFSKLNAEVIFDESADVLPNSLPPDVLRFVAYNYLGSYSIQVLIRLDAIFFTILRDENAESVNNLDVSCFTIGGTEDELYAFFDRKISLFIQRSLQRSSLQQLDKQSLITTSLTGIMFVRYGIHAVPEHEGVANFIDQMIIYPDSSEYETLADCLISKDHHNSEVREDYMNFIYHEITHCLAIGLINSLFGEFYEFHNRQRLTSIEGRKSFSYFGEGLVVELTNVLIGNGFGPPSRVYNYSIPIWKGIMRYLDALAFEHTGQQFVTLIKPESDRLYEGFKVNFSQLKWALATSLVDGTPIESSSEFVLKYDFNNNNQLAEVLDKFDILSASRYIIEECYVDYNQSRTFEVSSTPQEFHNRYSTRNYGQGDFVSYSNQILDTMKIWFDYQNELCPIETSTLVNSLSGEYFDFLSKVFVTESLFDSELLLEPYSDELYTFGGVESLF